MAGKFERKQTSDGQWMFNLKAGNGEIILTSERYTAKSGCDNGIASVQANSPLDERYERKEAKNGQPYFVLKAANHQVIGVSEMYSSKSAMETGIESVKTNGRTTSIVDV
ncbi:YegP family protein [uncultured Pseudodesulfovibrio sp.]|uniref:YegP family protein n=1 Tax=uncultured Pseudodesulfovibrio sp. TaxID=2035858 RepID=UPI0029C85BE1|nr:YegP family protein [uncultured Pseudodesulfovibrio sp.]